jgi:type I restriction enzyme M protein
MAEHTNARKQKSNGNGLEQTPWLAADKLRENIDAAEYKHIALGLIFLKYIKVVYPNANQSL